MTTGKDKTGDQLVASIRKSKTGAATRSTTTRRAPSKPAAPKADTAESKPEAQTTKPATVAKPKTASVQQDSYQSGRRVWPD